MAAPNLVNVTSIYGKTEGHALTTDAIGNANSKVLDCASDKVLKINSIIVANIDGSSAVDVDVRYYDSSATAGYYLAYTVSVPADTTLVVLGKDSPIYLEESDEINARAGAASDATLIISYEEMDDA
jgi:hypothetical protein